MRSLVSIHSVTLADYTLGPHAVTQDVLYLPLGLGTNCQLCKDHALWCNKELQPVPRTFIRPPYEISFEVALSRFLYNWDPFKDTYIPSHLHFWQSISSSSDRQTTLKSLSIPDWLITNVINIISVRGSDVIYQMVPYWPWKDIELNNLYSDGDGNHAYLIPDANPSNHFPCSAFLCSC